MIKWYEADHKTAKTVFAKTNPFLKPISFNEETTKVRFAKLSFYKKHTLNELTDFSGTPAMTKYALVGENTYPVDWTNGAIYIVNQIENLKLSHENIAEYLNFYLCFVKGENGGFNLVKNDSNFPIKTKQQEDLFNLDFCVIFKQSLFKTNADITLNGNVTIGNGTLIKENFSEDFEDTW